MHIVLLVLLNSGKIRCLHEEGGSFNGVLILTVIKPFFLAGVFFPLYVSFIQSNYTLLLTYPSSIILAYSNIQLHDWALYNICAPNRVLLPDITDNPFISLAGYPGTSSSGVLGSLSRSTVAALTESACLPEGDMREMSGFARQLSRSCQLFPAVCNYCVASDTIVRVGTVTLLNLTSECIVQWSAIQVWKYPHICILTEHTKIPWAGLASCSIVYITSTFTSSHVKANVTLPCMKFD